MSERRKVRFILSADAAHPPGERWPVVAKHSFGLTPEECAAFVKAGRVEFVVELLDSQRERVTDNLRQAAVGVEAEDVRGEYALCPRHGKLFADTLCTQCQGRACQACVRLTDDKVCAKCARSKGRRRTFRLYRVFALLLVLFFVAGTTYVQRKRISSWNAPVRISIVPIVAEEDPEVLAYVESLTVDDFAPITAFMDREAGRYGRALKPSVTQLLLARPMHTLPPMPPEAPTTLDVMRWSLELRYWAYKVNKEHDVPPAEIRLFLLYYRADKDRVLAHSLGLQQGHIGVVNLFASEDARPRNLIVATHELLHAAGATDKYGSAGRPVFPDGYPAPKQAPLHPQRRAEIMAGRIAVSPKQVKMPKDLSECVAGPKTAEEIGWRRPL